MFTHTPDTPFSHNFTNVELIVLCWWHPPPWLLFDRCQSFGYSRYIVKKMTPLLISPPIVIPIKFRIKNGCVHPGWKIVKKSVGGGVKIFYLQIVPVNQVKGDDQGGGWKLIVGELIDSLRYFIVWVFHYNRLWKTCPLLTSEFDFDFFSQFCTSTVSVCFVKLWMSTTFGRLCVLLPLKN